jgi:hypothetical protein
MGKYRELGGLKFNHLTAIEKAGSRKSGDALWRCRCDLCGDEYVTTSNELTSGKRKACPKHATTALKDRTGQRSGAWLVLRRATKQESEGRVGNNVGWFVRCEGSLPDGTTCGNTRVVTATSLKIGRSTSCGCQNALRHTTHGAFKGLYGSARAKGGSKEYRIFTGIRQRCENTKSRDYPRYGGSGIRCLFSDFNDFLSAMGGPCPADKSSVDRIDPNGHYARGNVRWATAAEQANNRRNNRRIAFGNREQTQSQWAHELGITPRTLALRLEKHPVEIALTLSKGAHARGSRDGYAPVRRYALAGTRLAVKALAQTATARRNGIDERLIWSRIHAARIAGNDDPDGAWLVRPARVTRRSRSSRR